MSELVPTKVFDFALNEIIEGEGAIEVAVRSHKGEIERVKNMTIGYYEGDMSIWFTQYPDAVIARNETIKMADAMKRFGQGF
ncbi:MAG: hypothetical protein Q8M92_03680, partial [Candidatus Subteraquimicrobiales bacterium]|nr:hypothetical protein [Candidatus Subteraquimicrobiales bacterium]